MTVDGHGISMTATEYSVKDVEVLRDMLIASTNPEGGCCINDE